MHFVLSVPCAYMCLGSKQLGAKASGAKAAQYNAATPANFFVFNLLKTGKLSKPWISAIGG